MDKKHMIKSKALIQSMQEKPIEMGKVKIQFARSNLEDIKRIEEMSDNDLISAYHSYAFLIDNNLPCSLKDIQLESLFCWEVESRGLWEKSKKVWLDKQRKGGFPTLKDEI